ncbi:ThuA domain-containing protein [Pontibacter sp. G13]|uniref:ThuA domain-containing protein n=1 Tax=Pontibacter sp. G13 TaxID=3074898 RepID=UPI0028891F1F|nr:ThuA domain-containing protein [Pontibacter sp. G13]WNJ18443.1 ThuA domain-containing protein [Pontibacter sp. G13]
MDTSTRFPWRQFSLVALLAIILVGTIAMNPTLGPAKKSPLKGKKVLFVYGGWKGHEPIKYRDMLVPWLIEEGAKVDTFSSLEVYADSAYMETVDLVLQIYTMSKITKEQQKGLLRTIRRGAGLAGWHGGLCDAFRNNPAYQYMTGGQWVSHPGGHVDYTVNFADVDDPLIKGLKDFDVHTEQYYMHVDPNVKVLATTTFNGEKDYWIDGCTMPIAWKKAYGQGRVFYTSLGHHADVFDQPDARKLLERGIRWASESKEKGPEVWITPMY